MRGRLRVAVGVRDAVRADALLLADLRPRIEAVSPDTPKGRLERDSIGGWYADD